MKRPLTESKKYQIAIIVIVLSILPFIAKAKCGSVDYSWGANALSTAHDYVVTMMLYVMYLCNAVGALIALLSALIIIIKINYGEGEFTKNVVTLLGALLFMAGATILFPAFFGYNLT